MTGCYTKKDRRINIEFRSATKATAHGGQMAINYNGDLAQSWQTLWAEPFMCDAVLGSPADHKFAPESCAHGRDVSVWMPGMLERCAPLGEGFSSHLSADSVSSAGHYLECIAKDFEYYSVSYNKWVGPLEQKAAELPEAVWSEAETVRWRDGKVHAVQYASPAAAKP
ncbi:hypothetical protein EGM51_08575 [Verrucomicrobia bacterium S94]|nr:hypothetical protein EGM51_08575 [Verrucomicrobia bacterium S94]